LVGIFCKGVGSSKLEPQKRQPATAGRTPKRSARVPSPSWKQFDTLIREARRQARAAGLTHRHVRRAIARVRGER
jgi:hypothetical protein